MITEHDPEPLQSVRSLVEAVNLGDFATIPSMFGANPLVIEDIAPFRWEGPEAPGEWLVAMGANAAALGVSGIHMALGEPLQLNRAGDQAYVAIPGHLSMQGGEKRLEADGLLTFTLTWARGAWLIDTLVWSGPSPQPSS